MIQREIDIFVTPTPIELATEFSKMYADEQAIFFSELANLIKSWDKPFALQLQAIIDSENLTNNARAIMRQIGEYGDVSGDY